MYKKLFLVLLLTVLFFLNAGRYTLNAEEVTITTYYPAPEGVYDELRAEKMGIGPNYYDASIYPIPSGTSLIVEGNVGIGTSNPATKLEIGPQNNLNEGGEIKFDGAGTNRYFYLDNFAGMLRLVSYDNPGESTKFTIRNDGNVGIGTTNPFNKLDIAGGAVIGATYAGANTAPTDGLLVQGKVRIGTTQDNYFVNIVAPSISRALNVEVTQDEGIAIYGKASTEGGIGAHSFGLFGEGLGILGYGVQGHGDYGGVQGVGGTYGLYGMTYGSTGGYGVYGQADTNDATGIGVMGSGIGYAGYFNGKLKTTNTGGANHVYDIAELIPTAKDVESGDVVIINPDKNREVMRTNIPYDERVAGVISENPWFSLGDKEKANKGNPEKHLQFITLAGQVKCNVDASYGEIKPGDWLTTSPTSGYAMVVKDKSKAQGTVIGKALEGIKKGKGKILILAKIG